MNDWEEKIAKAKAENAEALSLEGWGIKDISALASLSGLKKLELANCLNIDDFSPLQYLSNLEELHLDNVRDISFVSSMTNLTRLVLVLCLKITDLRPLSSLTNLKHLFFACYDELHSSDNRESYIKDLSPLASLTNLEEFRIFDCDGIMDLSPLSSIVNLRNLDLHWCRNISDLSPLSSLINLTNLNLKWCNNISDISPLSSLVNLTELNLNSCDISDLSPLSSLVNLTELYLSRCENISDLSPLMPLVNLTRFNLRACQNISDISTLTSFINLTELDLAECKNIKNYSLLGYLHKLTRFNGSDLSERGAAELREVMPKSSIEVINRDEQGRLHNERGPSISYKGGLNLYHWHGVVIPREWIEESLPSVEEALSLLNAEHRRAACEMIGWAKILEALDAEVINQNADPEIGTLLEVEIPDTGRERFLRVRCGTGREFVIPVPPDMKTARQANAWTWGLKASQYRPEVRT